MVEETNQSDYTEELEVIQESLTDAVDELFYRLGLLSKDSVMDPIMMMMVVEDLKEKIYTHFNELYDYSVMDSEDSEDLRILIKPKRKLARLLMIISQMQK